MNYRRLILWVFYVYVAGIVLLVGVRFLSPEASTEILQHESLVAYIVSEISKLVILGVLVYASLKEYKTATILLAIFNGLLLLLGSHASLFVPALALLVFLRFANLILGILSLLFLVYLFQIQRTQQVNIVQPRVPTPPVGIRIAKALFVLMICLGCLGIVGFFSIFFLPGDIGLILLIFAGAQKLLYLGALILFGGVIGLMVTRFLRGSWRIYASLAILIIVFGVTAFSLYVPYQTNNTVPAGLFGPTAASIPSGFHKNNGASAWSNSPTDSGYSWAYSNTSAAQIAQTQGAVSDFMSIAFKEDSYTKYSPPASPSYFAGDVDPHYIGNNGGVPQSVLDQIHSQPFTFEGSPGIVFSYQSKYTSGIDDNYALYWDDGGRQLQLSVVAPPGVYSAEKVIDILSTMKRY